MSKTLFYTRVVMKKNEKVAILESKKNMFVACKR